MSISALLKGFLAEAQGYVDEVRDALGEDGTPSSPERIELMYRHFHTLTGAAEMLGLMDLASLAAPSEEMLDNIIQQSIELDNDSHKKLAQALLALQSHLDELNAKSGSDSNGSEAQDQTHNGNGADSRIDDPPDISIPQTESYTNIPEGLLKIFALEASEHNQAIGEGLEKLRVDPTDRETLGELRRVIHTLKGAAATVGITDVARLSHLMEDLLDKLLEEDNHLNDETLDLLDETADRVSGIFESDHKDYSADFLAQVEARYAALLGDKYTPAPTQSNKKDEGSPELRQAMENILRIPQERVDELVNRVGEVVINRASIEGHSHSIDSYLTELAYAVKRLHRVARDIDSQVKTVSTEGIETLDPNFDPLELDRYSLLYQYTRELEELTSDTSNINKNLQLIVDDLDGAISRERRLTSELQDGLMATRLVPFHEIETRLQRIVNRTARDLGKSIRLKIVGGNTRVDKTVLNTLTDPLMHLIRNAIDHGLESPKERRLSGKERQGQITLTILRERSRVIIRISDDGAGVDMAHLRTKAVDSGLASDEDSLTDDDLLNILFEESFSLAETISETSGRGVGLNIVQHAVRQLQGTVRVTTSPGKGTTFTISVPITLAITTALYIGSGGQTFAVPLEQTSGVIRLEPETYQEIREQSVIRRGDETLSVFNLASFSGNGYRTDPSEAQYGLVIGQGDQQSVILISELQGTHDIVVKSLGTHLRRVHGVAGATISGEGKVVLILDLFEIVGMRPDIVEISADVPTTTSHSEEAVRRVLVVDDSLSVRRVVCGFLERSGWEAIPAKDGIDALDQISTQRPDVALVDIEMPRMNGFELLSTIRKDPSLADIPVVFLTSRSAKKHRDRAEQLGVDGYLVKPYQEENLLSELNRVSEK